MEARAGRRWERMRRYMPGQTSREPAHVVVGTKKDLEDHSEINDLYHAIMDCRESGNVRGFREALERLYEISHEYTFQCDEVFCETGVGNLLMDMTFSDDPVDSVEACRSAYFILYEITDCQRNGFNEFLVNEGLINKCVLSIASGDVRFQNRAMMLLVHICYWNRRASAQVQEQMAVPERLREIIEASITEATRLPDHREMFIDLASCALWLMFAISPFLYPPNYDRWLDAIRFVVEFHAYKDSDVKVVFSWADVLANHGVDAAEKRYSAFRVSRIESLIAMANTFLSSPADDDESVIYIARLFGHIIQSFTMFPEAVQHVDLPLTTLRIFLKSENDVVAKHTAKCFYLASTNEFTRAYLSAIDILSEIRDSVAHSAFAAKRYMILTIVNLVLEANEARLDTMAQQHAAFVIAHGLVTFEDADPLVRVLHALNVLLNFSETSPDVYAAIIGDLNQVGYLEFCDKVLADSDSYGPEVLEPLDHFIKTIELREETLDDADSAAF